MCGIALLLPRLMSRNLALLKTGKFKSREISTSAHKQCTSPWTETIGATMIRVTRPPLGVPVVPFIIDSPHSGTTLPQWADHTAICAKRDRLTQAEDSYVDELWLGAPSSGATLVAALFPRWFIDPNRAEDDIDPDLLDPELPLPRGLKLAPGAKSKLGVGLIRRLAGPEELIYNTRLSPFEVLQRVTLCHKPYHHLLASEMTLMHNEFGKAFLLDAHSMKSKGNSTTPDGAGAERPDIVIGDLDGASCCSPLTECVVESFRGLGYSVKVNWLYKGAFVLRHHGRPGEGKHAVQVEVNRALYMDEGSRNKHSDGSFSRLQGHLSTVASDVASGIMQGTIR